MVRAVEKVRERLLRATAALNQHQVPYAVIGGNAVAAWVSRIDEAAVRNTQSVDVLIRSNDFDRARSALESVGFVFEKREDGVLFLDGIGAHPRHSVTMHFVGESYCNQLLFPCPDICEVDKSGIYSLLPLKAVVDMELASGRVNGRVNVRDLIDVGLVDQSWTTHVPAELALRLQELLDSPDG